jgi:hypothetical protein
VTEPIVEFDGPATEADEAQPLRVELLETVEEDKNVKN